MRVKRKGMEEVRQRRGGSGRVKERGRKGEIKGEGKGNGGGEGEEEGEEEGGRRGGRRRVKGKREGGG